MKTSQLFQESIEILGRIHRLKKDDIFLLRSLIREHNSLYYEKESPIISDEEYDALFHALAKLEAKFGMIDENSPTARLAILTGQQFQKVRHRYPMISLDNTYTPDEIRAFEERARNIIQKKIGEVGDFDYYIQPKYDGLGLALIYRNGVLTQAITRGSGVEGEDVTLGAWEILGIPKKIDTLEGIDKMEIRGEVIMNRDNFLRVNSERMQKGERLFANPRNAASGSLRQINPLITRSRNLEFFAYSVPQIEAKIDGGENFFIEHFSDLMNLLESWGFARKDFSFCSISGIKNLETEIIKQTQWYLSDRAPKEEREYFEFDIDGMVIKLNDMKFWEILGKTEHHPRYSIAYKFPAKQVRTKILSIEHSVGRTGAITPVANLDPIEVTGVIVRRATLHNYDELEKKWVREGDYVFIMRAGEVIPEVVSVLSELRDGTEKIVFRPEKCPVCNSQVLCPDGKVAIFCPNPKCPAKIQGQMEMFVSRQAFNIDGLGSRQMALFLQKWWIKDFSSIFELKKYRPEILTLDGYQEKSVNNLLQSIEKSKNVTLDRVLVSLGIPHVGKKTAKQISSLIDTTTSIEVIFSQLCELDEQKLLDTKDIGPETARAVREFFEKNTTMIKNLFSHLRIIPTNISEKNTHVGIFSEKSFCVTGTFEEISREKIHKIIEENGGYVRSSVSKNLDYLIAGEKAGSKLQKAIDCGVSVISFEEMKKMLI